MAPSVSATTTRAIGGLDTDHAAAAMQVLQLEARRCYVDTLTLVRDPLALGGTFTARVTFRDGGRVMAVDAPTASFDDAELYECLTAATRGLVVSDAPPGSGMDVALPLSPAP